MARRPRVDGAPPLAEPVPPGWPGDDPTLPEELSVLGERPRHSRPAEVDRPGDAPGSGSGRRDVYRDEPDQDDPYTSGHDNVTVAGYDPDDSYDSYDGNGDDDGGDHDVDDDLVAGVQPAGRALVVMVLTLLLAMLVNADALVERAEREPPGPERDRALAVWHPVQDVSHALQLHRVRQFADWAEGDDADAGDGREASDRESPDGAPPGAATAGGPEAGAGGGDAEGGGDDAAAPDGKMRTPTEDAPLRLWVGGDFMAQALGESLVAASEATGLVDPVLHVESASGLTRQDYFDWPAALAGDVEEHDPEVVVVMVGANDGQGIVLADGTPVQMEDPRWLTEYRRRVGEVMDELRAPGRMVVWIGQPPMRSPDFAASQALVNTAYADEAAGRPWVTFVDAAAAVGGDGGAYADTRPDAAGAAVEVREADGIHLTPAGGDLLADHVMAIVAAEVDLSG